MKSRLLPLTSCLILASLAVSQAKEDAARLMLKSDGPADIEIVKTSDNARVVESHAKAVTLDEPVSAGQWSTASITFKVTADADIRLRLSATYTKTDEKWVYIDNVKAEGAQVENPDFEDAGPKAPVGWKFLQNGQGGVAASQLQDSKVAASGQGYVKVSHGCPVIQMIHVPKDTEVTISFSGQAASAD